MKKTMKAYISKYALTKGVFEVDAEVCSERMISYKRSDEHYTEHAHGDNWHNNKESAFARAEEMRDAKIISLKKQIAKLEKAKFNALVPAA